MKLVLVTLFLISLSVSALGTSKHFRRQTSIHSLHLEKISSLGSALKGLIQLADAGELAPVIEIIEEIIDELSGLSSSNQQDLAVLTQQHEVDHAAAQESIDLIEAALSAAHQDLDNNEALRQGLEDAIDANVNAINEASAATEAENARREAEHAANVQHVANVNAAVGAISDAQSVLEEIRAADLTVGGSFLQMTKKKFTKSLSLIQKKLEKVQLRTSPTEVYIKELIQIAAGVESQQTVNAELIDQLAALLESFRQSLLQEARDTQARDEEEAVASANVVAALADVIAAQQAALESNNRQLQEVVAVIANLVAQIANLDQNLADAQVNLQTIDETFAQQSQLIEGYIRRLEVDLDVLQRALVFVQTESAQIGEGPREAQVEVVEDFGVPVDGEPAVLVVPPPEPVWVYDPVPIEVPVPEVYAPEPAPWQEGPAEVAQDVVDGAAPEESEESEEEEAAAEEEAAQQANQEPVEEVGQAASQAEEVAQESAQEVAQAADAEPELQEVYDY